MTRAKSHFVYILVAGTCLAIHNIVLILADAIGFPLMASMLTSFAIVAVLGYVLHSLLTFHRHLCWLGFQRYVSAMSANILVAFAVTWICRTGAGLPMIVAAPLASVLMLVFNFLLSRWAIVMPARAAK